MKQTTQDAIRTIIENKDVNDATEFLLKVITRNMKEVEGSLANKKAQLRAIRKISEKRTSGALDAIEALCEESEEV